MEGVLFSPDGRWLAIADTPRLSGRCQASDGTELSFYDTDTWQPIAFIALRYPLEAWAFSNGQIVVRMCTSDEPGDELSAFAVPSGDLLDALDPSPLAPPRPTATESAGGLRATASAGYVDIHRLGSTTPWVRLGAPSRAVAVGGELDERRAMFAARWPDGSMSAWNIDESRPLSLDPPPPVRVTGLAVEDRTLVVAGADGSFWLYRDDDTGGLAGVRGSRSDATVKRALDVRFFAGREHSPPEITLLEGGDPDAPLTPGRLAATADCNGASCRFVVGRGSMLVSASDQPGQITAWDGFSVEPLGGDPATELFCLDGCVTVPFEECAEFTKLTKLFGALRVRETAAAMARGDL